MLRWVLTAMLAATGCYGDHKTVEPADMLGAAGRPYNVAPGSPAYWDSGYPIEAERPTARAPVDVGAHTEALTLNSTFTFINSENGAEIFRSNSPWDLIRCFVLSQGSTTVNNYWAIALTGGGTGATATHGSVQWKASGCSASACFVSKCTTGGACVNKGTAFYTGVGDTVFSGSPLDGFATQECRTVAPGFVGHPALKRYTP